MAEKNILDEYLIHQFANNIRLVYHHNPSRITHCGFVLDVGSRDETKGEMGMAHFIEHLFFKGTEKRKSIQILNRLEFVGGELNAYTSKDKTCVYASVPADYFARTLELLSDIIFHSNFPVKEMEKEKNVIHEEIDMYLDSPEENIMDMFQETAFRKSSLGFNILGTHDTLTSFTRDQVMDFYQSWYVPEKMAFVYNGNKSFKQVIQLCERYFGEIPAQKSVIKKRKLEKAGIYTPFTKHLDMEHVQSYLTMGGITYSNQDAKRIYASLIMNILGGPGLNSRLNLAIREKHGYAYDIEANYQAMRDLGTFQIFVGTDKKYLEKTLDLIHKELKNLCDKPMSELALHRYKNQFKGQIVMSEENRVSLALMSGKMVLDDRKIESLPELFQRIDSIKTSDLQECALEMFDAKNLSRLVFVGR